MLSPSPTHSFLLKLQRAREHLQAFEREASAWVQTAPYEVVDEPDPDPPPQPLGDPRAVARRFRVTRVDPVPQRLSLILGDCLFNLRSSLDHLALSLAMKHTPGMSPGQIRTSEFPIFQSSTFNRDTERTKAGCMDPRARAAIQALQPYHRGNDYNTHPLWQVHELNIIDKHRMLTVCTAMPSLGGEMGIGFQKPKEGFNFIISGYVDALAGELKVDAVLARYGVIPIDPNRDMNVQPFIPVEIAFGPGGPAALEIVVPTVQAMCDFVRDSVITTLSKYL